VSVVAEVLTLDLLFLMVAAGCVAGGIAAGVSLGVAWQIVIAAAVTGLGLVVIRPIAMRHLHKQTVESATNVDAMVGRHALVTQNVTQTGGLATVNGEVWSAKTEGVIVPVGAYVEIVRIDGVFLVVKPLDTEGNTNDR
jgi:membrane protein implicated in regulation of membrane protease activity